MTLKVSKNKTVPVLGLMSSTLAKNTGLIILMSIAMLIFCPGIFLTTLNGMSFRAEDYTSPSMLNVFYGVTAVISVALVCIYNFVNFSYLYKKSSSDIFHSLPLTRTGLLFSRLSAGIIEVLIPVTIGYIAFSALSAFYPAYVMGTFSRIASAYFVNVLYILAVSAFSMVFIICAGSAFDLILSFFGFNAGVLVVGGIIHALCERYLSGYSMLNTAILRALSPVYYLGEKGIDFAYTDNYSLSCSLGTVFAAIEITVIFSVFSALLYNFRKAERSEQAYAYKFIYIICGVLAGICGGYALSEIFVLSADTKEISLIGLISFVLGAVITTVVYGAVTDRGFKKFKKSIVLGGISVLAYGIIAVIIATGAFGYEKRIPEEKKIVSARVNFDDANVDFADSKYAVALHKAIIERGADDEYMDIVDTPHTYVRIFYYLDEKGDKVFTREYFVDKTKLKKELFAVYASENRFEKFIKILDSAQGNRVILWGDYQQEEDYKNLDGRITKAEAKEIIEVYKRELKAIGDEFYSEGNQTKRSVADVSLYVDNEEDFHIYTTEDFSETNAILRTFVQEDDDIKE